MKIQIKNADNGRSSEACIFELTREGYPEDSIIEAPVFNENNNSFWWGNCVAYLNQTCIIIGEQ